MEKKYDLIRKIIEKHPHWGVDKGWSWYVGGMKDSGDWYAGKMIAEASEEELQALWDKIVADENKQVVLLTAQELAKSEIIHSMGEGGFMNDLELSYRLRAFAENEASKWNLNPNTLTKNPAFLKALEDKRFFSEQLKSDDTAKFYIAGELPPEKSDVKGIENTLNGDTVDIYNPDRTLENKEPYITTKFGDLTIHSRPMPQWNLNNQLLGGVIKPNNNIMNVKLVSLTKSLVEKQELSAEELIVYVARVSNPSNQLNSETSDKLIAYLIKNKHWSPFEMVDMTVEIVTSRGIAQQILRHRSFSFQEFSQRYAEVTDFEEIQLRKTGTTNRQSSSEIFNPEIDYAYDVDAKTCIDAHLKESEKLYKSLLKAGVAKECARFVLPITTQTKIYMKGSIRSWIHYLQIRTDEHTQLEHRQVAMEILSIFKSKFPNISKALEL